MVLELDFSKLCDHLEGYIFFGTENVLGCREIVPFGKLHIRKSFNIRVYGRISGTELSYDYREFIYK